MANAKSCFRGLLFLTFLLECLVSSTISTYQVYIVYLGHAHNIEDYLLDASEYHVRLLTSVFESKEEATQSMIHSYKHSFSGFAAVLNATQANVLANTEGVISVFESGVLQLQTTRSWDFMGLSLDCAKGTSIQLSHGDDVVVGVIDSGVWPESASFKEELHMGPIPKSFKGKCVSGQKFNPSTACNRKLIGARYYLAGFERRFWPINNDSREYRSARDSVGHGTHTASIAVGSRSNGASFLGFGRGIARGGAPRARLAVYKACWNVDYGQVCTEEDVLAAFDDAVHDGVHVISASIGKEPPLMEFVALSLDIGSFHAMQNGISVVLSAGNSGPDPSLVANVNPWSICVAASSLDRSFPTTILMEDGTSFVGEGLIANTISGLLARAIYYFYNGICNIRNWRNIDASGKILLCYATDGQLESGVAEYAAYKANASALIFVQALTWPLAVASIIPVIRIDVIQGKTLFLHSNLTMVQIVPSQTAFNRSPAPVVSSYSSRGPSSVSPNILKPDISAPGTNILAAWPPNIAPSEFKDIDDRSVEWNFDSGTSMACPHVSGVVALLKSAHPDWSPAAIRSALMTTAYNTDVSGDAILVQGSTASSGPFDIGAGHINPLKAFHPGLVYDLSTRDYFIFLCNNGYTEKQIRTMVNCKPRSKCPRTCSGPQREHDWDMNYPSISISNLKAASPLILLPLLHQLPATASPEPVPTEAGLVDLLSAASKVLRMYGPDWCLLIRHLLAKEGSPVICVRP
ncbi:Subtilisin-like serine endopeptidase family protein [Striga hermonthica]|uniref:Subtilisin-like serine endopeptidase family protein n=1 Tax=Striga hermonthica TaxID=68872 RepID=A0A9N7NCJ2_STRHE|nr:Subtilisin-like serine endopeptidase family protein [Striga hermonthica]